MIDLWETILLGLLAAAALSGWVMAELDLRAAERELDALQADLDIALGWQERQLQDNAVVHTTLHLIEGGEV